MVHDPRTTIVFDDARHYIFTTRDKFDIITSDPIHPWVKGSATLYTQEYFELVKKPFEPRRHRHAMGAALRERFRRGEKRDRDVFRGLPRRHDLEQRSRTARATTWCCSARPRRRKSISTRSSNGSISEIFPPSRNRSTTSASSPCSICSPPTAEGRVDLAPWLEDAEINRDRNLRLQYLAGFRSTLNNGGSIAKEIADYRKFPDNLFTGSETSRVILKWRIKGPEPPK